MNIQTVIREGKALVTQNGLRCQGSRKKEPGQKCNKLLAMRSQSGQVAGSFKCERCGQVIEVEIFLPKPTA